ncbi:carboxypeptidase-like regulatory domain-containing protein [Hymenobacter agri]
MRSPGIITKLLLLIFLLLRTGSTLAQGGQPLTISGQVRDALTLRPLPFASVFLANTTYGTTTDSVGHFTLANVPGGQYELAASYVGYQLYTTTISLQKPMTLIAGLKLAPTALGEVVVRPEKNKPADFQKFARQFLGTSTWSQQCRIENPDDVVVVYNKTTGELTALAPRSLRVINPALGYRITYYNFDFKVLYKANRLEFVAAPKFEELTSGDSKQQQRWLANRRLAYAGSLPHFLRSVRENRVAQEGFLVQRLVSEANSEQGQQRTALAADSLAEVFAPEPNVLARVYRQPLRVSQFRSTNSDSSQVQLRFPETLQVTYQNEPSDAVYVAYMTLVRRTRQVDASRASWRGSRAEMQLAKPAIVGVIPEVSQLRLLGPQAIILPNGYLQNPLSMQVDGYWAFEKVGEALPLDYSPASLK